MRVRWEDVARETYDDMVSVLLYRIHPEAERIDGKGGDEGRDLQLATPDGLSIFQLKSFTGRMTKGRRAQVKKSLKRAQESNPAEWTLVVPIDPTPAENRWFEKLRGEASCPLLWRGRTWLDKEMSTRPEISRYFLNDADKEVIALLRELNEEQAAVSDVHVATERARALHKRLNEIDPFYSYDLTTGIAAASPPPPGTVLSRRNGDVRVDVHPKYRGAAVDRPITTTLELAFGPDDAKLQDEFVRSLKYGTAVSIPARVVRQVKIDAPGGLGTSFSGGSLELGQSNAPGKELSIVAELRRDEKLLASLPMTLHPRSRGQEGGILEGRDQIGFLNAEVTVNLEERTFTATFRLREVSQLPSALLPTLRWLRVLRAPNELVLLGEGGFNVSTTVPETEDLIDEVLVRVVEALDDIQRCSGVYFETPVEFTDDDIKEVFEIRKLLAGERVEGTW
ncbi:MAG: hypothetical protein IIC91_09105, partial [Chloroflexi bacterium]|nr:hypothetical protein [Chloroflexota bacterium]